MFKGYRVILTASLTASVLMLSAWSNPVNAAQLTKETTEEVITTSAEEETSNDNQQDETTKVKQVEVEYEKNDSLVDYSKDIKVTAVGNKVEVTCLPGDIKWPDDVADKTFEVENIESTAFEKIYVGCLDGNAGYASLFMLNDEGKVEVVRCEQQLLENFNGHLYSGGIVNHVFNIVDFETTSGNIFPVFDSASTMMIDDKGHKFRCDLIYDNGYLPVLVTAKSGINLRSGPGKEYSIIADLPYDSVLYVSSIVNGWAQVEYVASKEYNSENPDWTMADFSSSSYCNPFTNEYVGDCSVYVDMDYLKSVTP